MTRPKGHSLPGNLPPGALSREAAADYFSIGPTAFDRYVAEGILPRPRLLGSRTIWRLADLDKALGALPIVGDSSDQRSEDPWADVEIDP